MQWYYARGGQSKGPVDAETLTGIVRSGELGPGDLVWNESFGDEWRPAGSVPEVAALFGAGWTRWVSSGGSGGQTPNGALMAQARAALSGNWGISIGAFVVIQAISIAAGQAPFAIGALLLTGPLSLGLCGFFLHVSRGNRAVFGKAFDGFSRFGPALGLYLWMALLMFLWVLLAAIPAFVAFIVGLGFQWAAALLSGDVSPEAFAEMFAAHTALAVVLILPVVIVSVIVQLRYALAFFAMASDPRLGPRSALRRSIELMRGRKWKLFCLQIRFIGWALLCVLTFGIGLLWLAPYMNTALARFFDDVQT